MLCIFDLEFCSTAVSVALSRLGLLSLPLFLCQSHPVPFARLVDPCSGVRFCHSLHAPSWEPAVVFSILLQLLVLRPRPSACLPCLWGQREVGVGGGGLSWLPQDILHFLSAAAAASKFGGLRVGGEEKGSTAAHADFSGRWALPGWKAWVGKPRLVSRGFLHTDPLEKNRPPRGSGGSWQDSAEQDSTMAFLHIPGS